MTNNCKIHRVLRYTLLLLLVVETAHAEEGNYPLDLINKTRRSLVQKAESEARANGVVRGPLTSGGGFNRSPDDQKTAWVIGRVNYELIPDNAQPGSITVHFAKELCRLLKLSGARVDRINTLPFNKWEWGIPSTELTVEYLRRTKRGFIHLGALEVEKSKGKLQIVWYEHLDGEDAGGKRD